MATLCHCFHIRDPEEDVSTRQNWFCPNCIIHTLLAKFTAIFSKEKSDAPASTAQMAASLSSDTAPNRSSDATRSGQKNQDGRITEQENDQGTKSTGLQFEEEDVCSTCFEEYIPENPKIVLQCSHSYHLSCIFEWMERSENCPICDKIMIFDEAA